MIACAHRVSSSGASPVRFRFLHASNAAVVDPVDGVVVVVTAAVVVDGVVVVLSVLVMVGAFC